MMRKVAASRVLMLLTSRTNSEPDLAGAGQALVGRQRRAPDSLHGAGELNHDAVSGHAEDPSLMLRHKTSNNFLVGGERAERRLLSSNIKRL
jgi:hypothetical protein